jgi:peptide/nickel transport system permease protein
VFNYAARRVAGAILVMFAVVTATFFISRAVPVDPARAAAGLYAGAAQVEATRHELGLDRSVGIQYLQYLKDLAHGDLGISYATRQPLRPDLLKALPATLELVLWSFIIYVFAGVGAGILWAAARGRPLSGVLGAITGLCIAMPVFWLAIVLQVWVAGRLGWLPINGRFDLIDTPPRSITGMYSVDALLTGDFSGLSDSLRHLALPVTTLVVWMFAVAARMTQKSILAEMEQAYVRTAVSKGAGPRRVLLKHVLRNAINPVVTLLGLQFGWLLGGTIMVEVVFSWPGIGLYMYTALQTFDFPVISGVTIVITASFVLVNLLVDLMYPLLDPRIRTT